MKKNIVCVLIVLCLFISMASQPANADSIQEGSWYGAGTVTEGVFQGYSSIIKFVFEDWGNYGLWVSMHIPDFGLAGDYLPASIEGNIITIGDPSFAVFTGELVDNSLHGSFWGWVYGPGGIPIYVAGTWQVEHITLETFPGDAPGPPCENLPPMYCIGDAEYCSELVQFDPPEGEGYIDYPMNGETWKSLFR